MESGLILKGFVNAFIIVILVSAFVYWIIYTIRKLRKISKYWFKYKILKRKHKEEDVKLLMKYLDQEIKEPELRKSLLLNGIKPKKVEELAYIFKEMKGGNKK